MDICLFCPVRLNLGQINSCQLSLDSDIYQTNYNYYMATIPNLEGKRLFCAVNFLHNYIIGFIN